MDTTEDNYDLVVVKTEASDSEDEEVGDTLNVDEDRASTASKSVKLEQEHTKNSTAAGIDDPQCIDCVENESGATVSQQYVCGSCWSNFVTACKLHAHIEAHGLGGSFYYDHRLKVAYPKYDNVCSETQTDVGSFEADSFQGQDSTQNQKIKIGRLRGRFCKLSKLRKINALRRNCHNIDDSDLTSATGADDTPHSPETPPASTEELSILTRTMRKRKYTSVASQTDPDQVTVSQIEHTPRKLQKIIWKPTTHLIVKLPVTVGGVARQPTTTGQGSKQEKVDKQLGTFLGSAGPKDPIPGSSLGAVCSVSDSRSTNPSISAKAKKTEHATLSKRRTTPVNYSKFFDVDSQDPNEIKVKQEELDDSEDDWLESSTNRQEKLELSENEAPENSTHENSETEISTSTAYARDKLGKRETQRVGVPIALATGFLIPEYIQRRETKKLENIRQQNQKIKVTLANHPEKYFKEEYVSMAMMDRGKSKEEKTSVLMVCALCKKYKTENTTALELHLEQHLNGEFKCKVCGVELESISERVKHMQQNHKEKKSSYTCPDCLLSFHMNQRKINDHMANVHGKKGFVCKFCSMVLDSQDDIPQHSIAHHNGKLKVCPKCNGYFSSKAYCLIHRETCGRKKRRVPCHLCGKEISQQALYIHVKRVHENERKLNCSFCSYSAFTKQLVINHTRAKHTGERMFKCDDCDFTCVTSCQLKSHRRTHTGETPFKCDQCSYAAAWNVQVSLYKCDQCFYAAAWNVQVWECYKCDQCSFTAAWNVQLKDHKKLHGLPSSAMCGECGILVKNVNCLDLHIRKEHSDIYLKDHKKLHGLPSSVICGECGILVKNVNCLNLHIRKEHSDKTHFSA